MNTPRQQRILALLKERGEVASGGLAGMLGVTPMTVWRDLRALDEQGLLRRIRGGAQARGAFPGEDGFESKASASENAKRRIAALAAREFVRPGEVIAMEGGTTVAALVPFLPADKVTVITNSLPVATRLRAERPHIPVTMPGGWLSAVSGNLCGPDAARSLARMESSVCFIGATGFDATRGLMDPNPLEIEAKRAMTAKSRRVVVLLDASKWSREAACVTLHPRRIHAVITDGEPPPRIAALLKTHGTRVLVVRAKTG